MASIDFNAKVEIKLNPKWERVEELLAQAIQVAARNIETGAKRDVAVDTGATRNSIMARETGRLEWTVGASTHYAPHIEFGTIHMTARPFMNTNLEKERPRVLEAVRQITRDL
tara:strand:- start:38 stop:376 length:339 start_codon:yes stop_codon:yes gene_type:complete